MSGYKNDHGDLGGAVNAGGHRLFDGHRLREGMKMRMPRGCRASTDQLVHIGCLLAVLFQATLLPLPFDQAQQFVRLGRAFSALLGRRTSCCLPRSHGIHQLIDFPLEQLNFGFQRRAHHAQMGNLWRNLKLVVPTQPVTQLGIGFATLQGHGIIYTLTVRDANQVADWLKTRGFNVEAYTGETGDRREALEQALLNNEVKALVATTALGMGYDKPDLAFVIHYQMPGSVVAYYQQVGRAGRALDSAYGVLLSGQEESDITDWLIRSAFPTRQEVADVLGALEEEENGLSVPELLGRVNLIFLKPAPAGCLPHAARSRWQSTHAPCATWESHWATPATGNRCAANRALRRTPHTDQHCLGAYSCGPSAARHEWVQIARG